MLSIQSGMIALAAFVMTLQSEAAPIPGSAEAPHLFFILVDDMGFNDFSYRSSDLKDVAWPNVNKLADEALKVDQYYTQALCSPTRGAFMTGRYPARLGLSHGVIGNYQDYGLPLDEVTLADKLKDRGYATHAVGKWHLGSYNFESTPTHRGFDTYLGYYAGMSDYFTHEIGGYLDLHRQWNSTNSAGLLQNGTYMAVRNESGVYSTNLFAAEMTESIKNHKASHGDKPGFFYLPLQNVHAPLESPGGKYDEACKDIPNANRKTFCAMAAIADEAIGNLTSLIKKEFAGDEYLIVISGDNGGMPNSAGNNFPLRGHKAELWEGGVRNNAIVLGTKLPSSLQGTTYTGGYMHVTDWHVTLATLGGATLPPKGPMDGHDMWTALTTNGKSPRTEIMHNYDPCSGHGSCSGIEWSYRSGDMKMTSGVAYDTWYSLPTSDSATEELAASTAQETTSGGVWWPEDHYYSVHSESNMTVSLAAASPTTGLALFNISADPYEQHNLILNELGEHADLVAELQKKIDTLIKGDDYMAPCNIPGGSCDTADPAGSERAYAHQDAYPWVGTTR